MLKKLKLKWSFFLLIFCIFLTSLVLNSYAPYLLYSGSFNLYLNQNRAIGSQLLNYYVNIESLDVIAINTTATITGRQKRLDVYESFLTFISNTDGHIRILTNIEESDNQMIRVSINDDDYFTSNNEIFSFSNGDTIQIYFRITDTVLNRTQINAIYGIIGIGLFCANPVLSYILTNKAKDKFHFFFILMAIGIISIGLMFSFIYG